MARNQPHIIALGLLFIGLSAPLRSQNYWQQEVDYLIELKLNDSASSINGHITMHYTNNSPNSLSFIYIHLMPDAYLGKRSALNNQLLANDEYSLHFANKVYRGCIDSLSWKVNGMPVIPTELTDTVDIIKLYLPEPLPPGETVRMETPFYVKLPSTHISRIGYKDHSYYLTQWYPKPAVYDNQGWHPMSYLDKGEFYSEFGNYEVHITVPDNFVVAASGELITPKEIIAMDTLANFSSTYVHPKRRQYLKTGFIPSTQQKTVTYRIQNVHDFAICIDPELLLMRDTIQIENQSITIQSFVKRSHVSNWKESNQYAREALEYFTKEVGPYPYNVFSLVDADDITGGDMEYPTIAWINHSYSFEEAIVLAVGHSWFYGVLATNERDEHWMDEGINTFYETQYFSRKYPDQRIHYYAKLLDGTKFPYYQQSHTEYYSLARLQKDAPVNTTSHLLNADQYLVAGYSKPAAFTNFLYNICGADTFRLIMHDYYSLWKFKHPDEVALHEVFKKYLGDKADWYFDQAMTNNKRANYVIKSVKKSKDGEEIVIEIENKGDLDLPVYIETYSSTKKLNTYSFDPIGKKGSVNIPYELTIEWIAIDNNMSIPDIDLTNNYVRIKNSQKISKPVRFNFFSSYENPYRKHIYYLPAVSVNIYDALQVGMIFHNYSFVPKKTEWFVIPMFGTYSLRPCFFGSITHTHLLNAQNSDKMEFKTSGNIQTYRLDFLSNPLWSFQLSPSLKFTLERRNIYSPLVHEFGLKNQMVLTQVDPALQLTSRWKFLMQNILYYKLAYKNRLWYVENTTSLEHVYDFGINYALTPLVGFTPAVKLYNEFKVILTYFKGKSTIQLRVFAGTFLTDPSMVTDTRFRLSGWQGIRDYAFNEYYMGRSEASGFFSQHVSHHDGDFKTMSFVGQTNQWMITANLEWDIPMIYAGAFMDIGTYSGAGTIVGTNAFAYSGGIYLRTPDRTLQIYFPLIASSDIVSSVNLNTTTYWERIRFTVQLQNFQLIKNIRKLFI